jgi:hypothetical protein
MSLLSTRKISALLTVQKLSWTLFGNRGSGPASRRTAVRALNVNGGLLYRKLGRVDHPQALHPA